MVDSALLEMAVRQSDSAFAIADMEGYNLFINDAWAAMHGYTVDELIGTHMSIFHDEKQFKEEVEPFIGKVMSQGYHEGEDTHLKKDGSILHTWMVVNVINDEAGNPIGIAGACRDITDRIEARKALKQARLEAEAASRAKSTFLANMSHELRTPLSSILGFAQILNHDESLDSKRKKYLDIIKSSGEHLLSLINDILEISKIEAGYGALHNVDFNLKNMLGDIAALLELEVDRKGLNLTVDVAAGVPNAIKTDRKKLSQILINLIGNAIKATLEGEIRVEVSAEKFGVPSADSVVLGFKVIDTGMGIEGDYVDSIFDPFTQVEDIESPQEGTGLGLAICREFVQMMGGEISAESKVGQGTTFEFTVQAKELVDPGNKEAEVIDTGVAEPSDLSQYRMLIVDDIEVNREYLKTVLMQLGFEVREAMNGEEALDIWKEWKPHLVWMDMRMPVMSGYEATRVIKTLKNSQTKVVAVTAAAFQEQQEAIVAVGCDDLMRKPFEPASVSAMIEKHLKIRVPES